MSYRDAVLVRGGEGVWSLNHMMKESPRVP